MAQEERPGPGSTLPPAPSAHAPLALATVRGIAEPRALLAAVPAPRSLRDEQSSLGKPYIVFRMQRLREFTVLSDLQNQLYSLQRAVEAELAEKLRDRGTLLRQDPSVQGIQLHLVLPGGDEGSVERLYRFQIGLWLDQSAQAPAQVVPRLFGEVVRRSDTGFLFGGSDKDPEFAALIEEIVFVFAQMGGQRRSALLAHILNGQIGQPFYCSRLYTIRYFSGDAAEIMRQLQQCVSVVEMKLREAFRDRKAEVLPHPQSQRVELTYVVPSPIADERLFRFQIELQLGTQGQGIGRSFHITPRLFAEVVRQDSQGVKSMGQGNDEMFGLLVQEVQALLHQMAPF